jgi:hypothetical protein
LPYCGGSDEQDTEGTTSSDGSADSNDSASETENKLPLENITVTKCDKVPTVAIVEWPEDLGDVDKKDITDAYVEFGLGDTFSLKAPVNVDADHMRTNLLGMKAGAMTYGIRSTVKVGDKTFTSDVVEFETGYTPTDFLQVTESYRHASLPVEEGYILTSTFANPSYVMIIDTEGDPVWWTKGLNADGSSSVGTSDTAMDWNGEYIYMIATNPDTVESPIRRVPLGCGEAVDFPAGRAHHSLKSVPEGGVVFVQRTEYEPGVDTCDAIVHLDEEGNLTEIFNWTEAFPFVNNCHTNFVGYEEDIDSFYMSSRNFDVAAMVTRDGELRWAIGRDDYQTAVTEDFEIGEVGDIIALHGLYAWNEGRSLLLFNNTSTSTSKIFEYKFNDDYTEAATEWSYERDGAGSREAGGVQRLPNGNTQITYSTDSTINQISPDGEVVHRVDFSTPVGYGNWMKTLYRTKSESK